MVRSNGTIGTTTSGVSPEDISPLHRSHVHARPTSTIGANPNLFRTLLIDASFPLNATRGRALSAPDNWDTRLTERRTKNLRLLAQTSCAGKETCERGLAHRAL